MARENRLDVELYAGVITTHLEDRDVSTLLTTG